MKTLWLAGIAILTPLPGCALSPRLQNRVSEDWNLAHSIHGSGATPLHRQLFGNHGLNGEDYRAFFEHRVRDIKGEGLGFASCHGALACQTDNQTIRLSESYGNLPIPPIIRLSFLLHEARHAEGYEHVPCPSPLLGPQGHPVISPYQKISLSGKTECDANALGADGVQIVMLKNVALYCKSCPAELRREADEYSKYLMSLIVSTSAKKILSDDSDCSR